jgi:hypothetical protein
MTDLTRVPAIQTPEQYEDAKRRLKRLQESPDPQTDADIVTLRQEIEKFENTLSILTLEPGFREGEEHA